MPTDPKHLIEVTVTQLSNTGEPREDLRVTAEPNPLPQRGGPDVDTGDSVTWQFKGLPEGLLPLLIFREVRPLPSGPGSDIDRGLVDLLGPFETLSLSRDRVVASGADDRLGRFIYQIAVIDPRSDPREPEIHKLGWVNRLDGENFGGIDKPRTPEGR